jgi:hypothetical protein
MMGREISIDERHSPFLRTEYDCPSHGCAYTTHQRSRRVADGKGVLPI